jgi:hypothetical protein
MKEESKEESESETDSEEDDEVVKYALWYIASDY